eukprot:gene4842-9646_t
MKNIWIIPLSLLFIIASSSGTFTSGSPKTLRVIKRIGRGGSSEEYDSDDYSDDEKSSASVQYMITNRMRRVLTDDLGYMDSEVESMAPEVAAVVIERGLQRPSNGMPASWRRKRHRGEGLTTFLNSFKKIGTYCNLMMKSILSKVKNTAIRREALPVVAIIVALIFRSKIMNTGTFAFGTIKHILRISFKTLFIPFKKIKALTVKPKPPPINLNYIDALQKRSWMDAMSLKAKDIKRKFL